MLSEIGEIKNIRKRLGLTQAELAAKSGLSQSMIAKIEAGNIEPGYTNTMKIFRALDDQSMKEEAKAGALMNEKVIWISPKERIREAIKKMQSHGFSQLPVIQDHAVLGMITESAILNSLLKKKGDLVEEVMESPPPVVSIDASSPAIINLLRYYPMVLVSKRGRICGVITKTDVLVKVHEKR